MSYRVDWPQFFAALVAAGIWSHRRDVNEIGAASNE